MLPHQRMMIGYPLHPSGRQFYPSHRPRSAEFNDVRTGNKTLSTLCRLPACCNRLGCWSHRLRHQKGAERKT